MESTMTLTGYVGQNIELRQTRTGVATVSFRMGTTPRIKTASGWIDGATTWTNVVCYRALADNVAQSIKRGDPVIIHGRVRTQVWTDPQGGEHEKTVLEAQSVGHDLNRGVSAFTKAPRSKDESMAPDSSVHTPEDSMPEDSMPDSVPEEEVNEGDILIKEE